MNVVAATLIYNTPDLVANMRAQIPGIVIVDNGSEPPIDGAQIVLPRLTFSAGWNAALKCEPLASADYCWLCNSDITGISPDMLEQLAWFMESMQKYKYAAVTPAFNSPHEIFHPHGIDSRDVKWIDFTCPLMSMEAWKDVGPLDERLPGYGADLDWFKRARDKSYRFAVADMLIVHHIGSVTALRFGLQGSQGDVGLMNRVLHDKYGVNDWSELTV